MNHPVELLAPARNADFGMAAIDHGADAVYIGGPAFGARSAAGNSMDDIARLTTFAHQYRARVLLAINTILTEEELEAAGKVIWQAWDAGVDALIVQDMGLLELDLPPIALHASTQCDIRTAEKATFLEQVGFSQMVLARELSLPQIQDIAATTNACLEFFVHGALCVSYSGQCYISHAHTGRSANRGECSQACRLPYDLADSDGSPVAAGKHLLSMKDNDQTDNLSALLDAGIRSFKIEGRLKDLAYVKNITAHYRQSLDTLLASRPALQRASSGRSTFTFTPQPEKTFNRGKTDYFVHGRQQEVGAFDTPKFTGEAAGTVGRIRGGCFTVDSPLTFHNGDGISYYDANHQLTGLRINRVDGEWLTPAQMPQDLLPGTPLFRNHDQSFERLLEKPSAKRHVAVDLELADDGNDLLLTLRDEDGVESSARLAHEHTPAHEATQAREQLARQLTRLGSTPFAARQVSIALDTPWFLPASAINQLRRNATDALLAERIASHPRPPRLAAVEPPPCYPAQELSYLGNVLNSKARAFYVRHGITVIADAYEANQERGAVSLMITKHCLRYSYNLCPRQVKGIRPDPMTLIHGQERLTLRFDCKPCEMHVVGRMKKQRQISLKAMDTPPSLKGLPQKASTTTVF